MKRIKSLLLPLVALISTSVTAQTTPPAKLLALDIAVGNAVGLETFAATGGSDWPIYFNATLQIAQDILSLPCYEVVNVLAEGQIIIDCVDVHVPPKADFYFGVIGPGGSTYSLVAGSNANPLKGLVPIATNVDLSKARTLDLNESVGSISYAFDPEATQGMYTVFALLVRAGGNPANTQNWLEAEMKPLMVEPASSD